jgi:hypothetical protein
MSQRAHQALRVASPNHCFSYWTDLGLTPYPVTQRLFVFWLHVPARTPIR